MKVVYVYFENNTYLSSRKSVSSIKNPCAFKLKPNLNSGIDFNRSIIGQLDLLKKLDIKKDEDKIIDLMRKLDLPINDKNNYFWETVEAEDCSRNKLILDCGSCVIYCFDIDYDVYVKRFTIDS